LESAIVADSNENVERHPSIKDRLLTMDALYEILTTSFDSSNTAPDPRDPHTTAYLSRLSTLSLDDLTSTESASILYASQSHVRGLQALSKRSRNAVISSSAQLASLTTLLPTIANQSHALRKDIPSLENVATAFSEKYDRSTENGILDRRKRAALLSRNVDRLSDVLDLPGLLSSTVTAAHADNTVTSSASSASTSYASALDIQAHIKRLHTLYPQSELVGSISKQSGKEMQNLATILITSLQSPTLKLAAAMRTIGYLRRVAPDLVGDDSSLAAPGAMLTKPMSISAPPLDNDNPIGALFLVCRLHTLHKTLRALDPLRDLADQETLHRSQLPSTSDTSGSQTERFLKRYIEVFREQSFGILSMYKSIFPASMPHLDSTASTATAQGEDAQADPLRPLPSSVTTFSVQLVDLLETTLREYFPNILDKAMRESLLTQVLYCAGSLGRLGAEFGMTLALLEEDLRHQPNVADTESPALATGESDRSSKTSTDPEWVAVMQKHRVQASRLEVLARGVGTSRKTSASPMPVLAG
jgi:hypothetical protein